MCKVILVLLIISTVSNCTNCKCKSVSFLFESLFFFCLINKKINKKDKFFDETLTRR